MIVADYATITLPATFGNPINETSYLVVTGFNAGVNPAGFVGGSGGGAGAANPGGTPYQLYFAVNSVSHATTPLGPNSFLGVFDSLNYTFFGDVGGNCTFSPSGPSCGADQQLALATGTLSNQGLNQANILSGIPSANADATIAAGANAGGFFVSPANLLSVLFEASFTNTPGVVTQNGNVITINGGGGNVDMVTSAVPEPMTLSLFGAGLIGAGALRRRLKAKKA